MTCGATCASGPTGAAKHTCPSALCAPRAPRGRHPQWDQMQPLWRPGRAPTAPQMTPSKRLPFAFEYPDGASEYLQNASERILGPNTPKRHQQCSSVLPGCHKTGPAFPNPSVTPRQQLPLPGQAHVRRVVGLETWLRRPTPLHRPTPPMLEGHAPSCARGVPAGRARDGGNGRELRSRVAPMGQHHFSWGHQTTAMPWSS